MQRRLSSVEVRVWIEVKNKLYPILGITAHTQSLQSNDVKPTLSLLKASNPGEIFQTDVLYVWLYSTVLMKPDRWFWAISENVDCPPVFPGNAKVCTLYPLLGSH